MSQRIPLAWRQLTFEPMKLVASTGGVVVSVTLMWMQLGILASLYDSATVMHGNIVADFVVIHPQSENLRNLKAFSSRSLFRLRGHPDVTELAEFLTGNADWRVPETGNIKQIAVYGVEPEGNWLALPGIAEHANALRGDNTFLFDRNSRNVFGRVLPALAEGRAVHVEVSRRKMKLVGLTAVASSFGQEGCMVLSRANFLRVNERHAPNQLEAGFVRIRPGADREVLQAAFNQFLAPEARVLTPSQFKKMELDYWRNNAPVGFIFTTGTVVGFFVGFVVVYQILYNDVTNHLPQYATLKAMGFSDGWLLRHVIREGMYLAVCGYIPGTLCALGLYRLMHIYTGIPMGPTWSRAVTLLLLTSLMCFLGGVMATRRLREADPADVF